MTSIPNEALLRASIDVAVSRVNGPLVLAVSGGRDSMALLQAMARWAPDRLAAVATYDHGTGSYATDAASLVVAEGRRLGLSVMRERARTVGTSEAEWRAARWSFLHRVARAYRASVVTAHTRDDQVETIVMRLLRGAGARGLAALAAPGTIVRPWLGVSRAEVAEWVEREQLQYLDDPTNATLHFLRGRLRHDLLPQLEAAQPGFAVAMLDLGQRAATWRLEVETFLDTLPIERVSDGVVRVPAEPLERTTNEGRAVLWAALFARVRVALDARGTDALVRFTNGGRRGAHITLAGQAAAVRVGDGRRDLFELRRNVTATLAGQTPWVGTGNSMPMRFGGWHFRRITNNAVPDAVRAIALTADPVMADALPNAVSTREGMWYCALPATAAVRIRSWRAGDRLSTDAIAIGNGAQSHRATRRVARYFAEAQVPALDRPTWPVVLCEDEIVWIPGVCRSAAAPYRPGRPDSIWYRCERQRD